MSVKVFYTSIHGFLPHQLSRPSIHTTLRLTDGEHKTSQRTVRHMTKVSKRHYLSSLKITVSKTISVSKKLRRSNFNTVN